MLLDSNIIIYAMRPEHEALRAFIAEHSPAVSGVSYVETLGYHKLTPEERDGLEAFFEAAVVLPIDRLVLVGAVRLRQGRKMSLGDSLVAATALEHALRLVTRNTRDFQGIEGLNLLDPLESPGGPSD